jgi:hypothetical protein
MNARQHPLVGAAMEIAVAYDRRRPPADNADFADFFICVYP